MASRVSLESKYMMPLGKVTVSPNTEPKTSADIERPLLKDYIDLMSSNTPYNLYPIIIDQTISIIIYHGFGHAICGRFICEI
jgi:hypothetical protein